MARFGKPRLGKDAPDEGAAHPAPAGPTADFAAMLPGHRRRHDGWNEERLQRFLDVLGHTGCVEDACRVCGMSDIGARRLKARYPLFAAAWADALARAQQGLVAIAYNRAVEGRETIIIRKGEEYERRIQPSDAMLRLLIARGDMSNGVAAQPSEEVLTFQEWRDGWRFKKYGGKWKPPSNEEVEKRLAAKFAAMRHNLTDGVDPF